MAASAVMDKAGTARFTFTGDAEGSGTLAWKAPRMLELTMPVNGKATTMRIGEDAMYIATPAESLRKAGGKHWMKIDRTAAAAMGDQAGSGVLSLFVELYNPVLELRAAVQDNAITKIGPAKVNGTDTVHYIARVTDDTLVAQMTSLTDDARKQALDTLRPYGPTTSVEFWINDRNELVQLGESNLSNTSQTATTLIGYSDLAATPALTTPDPSDTLTRSSQSAV